MGYYSEWKKEEARKKHEAVILSNENKLLDFKQRHKAVSDNLKGNKTKSNKRAERLLCGEIKGLEAKLERLKNGGNE